MMHCQLCQGITSFPVDQVFSEYHARWWREILLACSGVLPHNCKDVTQASASGDKQYALLCCRLSSKMPIQTEKGKLHVDLKALGQVLWRSTIVHIFR